MGIRRQRLARAIVSANPNAGAVLTEDIPAHNEITAAILLHTVRRRAGANATERVPPRWRVRRDGLRGVRRGRDLSRPQRMMKREPDGGTLWTTQALRAPAAVCQTPRHDRSDGTQAGRAAHSASVGVRMFATLDQPGLRDT